MANEVVKGVITNITDGKSGQIYAALDGKRDGYGVWDKEEQPEYRAAMGKEVSFEYVVMQKGEKTYKNTVDGSLKVLGDAPPSGGAFAALPPHERASNDRTVYMIMGDLVEKLEVPLAQKLAAWSYGVRFMQAHFSDAGAKGEIDEKTLANVTAEDITTALAEKMSMGVASGDEGPEWDEAPQDEPPE